MGIVITIAEQNSWAFSPQTLISIAATLISTIAIIFAYLHNRKQNFFTMFKSFQEQYSNMLIETKDKNYNGENALKKMISIIQSEVDFKIENDEYNLKTKLSSRDLESYDFVIRHTYGCIGSNLDMLVKQCNIIYKHLNTFKCYYYSSQQKNILLDFFNSSISNRFKFLIILLYWSSKQKSIKYKTKIPTEYFQLIQNFNISKKEIYIFDNFIPGIGELRSKTNEELNYKITRGEFLKEILVEVLPELEKD